LLASLPEPIRTEHLARLSTEAKAALKYHWPFWARPNQLPPAGQWSTWLALAGRGFGKTEAGAQWVRQRVKDGARSIALVAETQKDLEEVMVARLLRIHPEKERPEVRYKPVRVHWPNGAIALGYNGTEPDQLRGPEFDTAWVDELAKYRYAQMLWDMLTFTMRSGDDPRVLVTTTPRPIPIIRKLVADSQKPNSSVKVVRGSTFDNAAHLPKKYLDDLEGKYAGTRLGRQELNAEILDDLEGALWKRDDIDKNRIREIPAMQRIVVAVDPSGTKGEPGKTKDAKGREMIMKDAGDDIGIVVAGKGVDGRCYILADMTCNLSPDGWGKRAVAAYYGSWAENPEEMKADRLVAERNFGGAMVEHVIKTIDSRVAFKEVTASRGKFARAEPVAALYEQGKVSHVGSFPQLEDQMCLIDASGYIGEGSPDRADALVWAVTELMLDSGYQSRLLEVVD
jgi:phage terminase large subunit-like protein